MDFNGIKIPTSPGVKYGKAKELKAQYLQRILMRLQSETAFFFECFDKRREENPELPPVGFFGFIRLLMPVIEAVARADGMKAYELLKRLNVPAPVFTWTMYRNIFLHGDEFVVAFVENRPLSVGIAISEANEPLTIHSSTHINVRKLYYDLISYLDEAILNCKPDEHTEVFEGVHISSDGKVGKAIIEEINNL